MSASRKCRNRGDAAGRGRDKPCDRRDPCRSISCEPEHQPIYTSEAAYEHAGRTHGPSRSRSLPARSAAGSVSARGVGERAMLDEVAVAVELLKRPMIACEANGRVAVLALDRISAWGPSNRWSISLARFLAAAEEGPILTEHPGKDPKRSTASSARRPRGTGALFVKRDSAGRETWQVARWHLAGQAQDRSEARASNAGRAEAHAAEAELRRLIGSVNRAAIQRERVTIGQVGELLIGSLQVKGRKRATIETYGSALRIQLVGSSSSRLELGRAMRRPRA
jgi:hypothetical protein